MTPINMMPTVPRVLVAAQTAGPWSRFRHLSTEMANRRAKGLCYNCSEKFYRDHQCSMKGIDLLELDEDDVGADTTT